MNKRLICPKAARPAAEALKMSPGILSGNHLFLTGVTAANADGSMPVTAEAQFRSAFTKITSVLAEANLTPDHVVEMTSYHIGLRDHFDLFDQVRLDIFSPPYPAWTAIEAGGLRRDGAVVEIRIIAAMV